MKIGIITNSFPSVSETFITNIVIGLCSRGHEVVVFKNQKGTDGTLENLYNLKAIRGLKIISVKQNFITAVLKNPLLPFTLFGAERNSIPFLLQKNIFKQYKCDIYHFQFSGLAIQYMPLFKKLPGIIVTSCRGTAENVKPITDEGRKEKLKKLFDLTDKIHCVSDNMSSIIRNYGAKAEKIFINRPAVDIDVFKRSKKQPVEEHVVLSVGRLTFQKGYLIGLLAFKELLHDHPAAKWIIIGEGSAKEELLFYINSMNLQRNVFLAGKKNRDEIINFYKIAKVFFLPSVYEGIANSVLEAMSMELPVVVTKAGGMQEVIEDSVDGLLSEVYDHSKLAGDLKRVLSNEKFAETLGANARKKVESEFNVGRQLDIFEKEYKLLLERNVSL